ncbi:hypothetical protein NP493_591g02052 [Ridgeia piscesae]|uniref:Uncharacterized protein n=1 Tax=Ridgeia piscesae TaxID=27915 RepID=A0AAD9NR14_RIDPI|nr:hypothetical protein NP493_591g02052 [Ridgeia piscesae]
MTDQRELICHLETMRDCHLLPSHHMTMSHECDGDNHVPTRALSYTQLSKAALCTANKLVYVWSGWLLQPHEAPLSCGHQLHGQWQRLLLQCRQLDDATCKTGNGRLCGMCCHLSGSGRLTPAVDFVT